MHTIRNFISCLILLMSCWGYAQVMPVLCHIPETEVTPLDKLNTKSIEFSPAFYRSGIVYVMAREKVRLLDPKTGRAYFDLMYADVGPYGETSTPVSFSSNIRTQFHEGPCAITEDGSRLFFTRSNLSGGTGIESEKGEVQLKIYSATKGESDWENVTELPFSSDEYSVAHPAIWQSTTGSPDLVMVFSSNMPGGKGGMDLYKTTLANGQWSSPENLGDVINTKGNEIFPTWHPSGVLSFSSDGHKGMGGLDLFVTSSADGRQFDGFQHLEAPLNSKGDDLGLIISADGKFGYFASDRKPTKGKDDLYRWNSMISIFCREPEAPVFEKMITIREEGADPVENAYVWLIPMQQEGPSKFQDHFTTELVPRPDKEGAFYLRWGITDTLSIATADGTSNHQGETSLQVDMANTYILAIQRPGFEPFVEVYPKENVPVEVFLKKLATTSPSLPSDKPCIQTTFYVLDEKGVLKLNGASVDMTGPCLPEGARFYTDEAGVAQYCIPAGCQVRSTFQQEGYAPHTFSFTADEENAFWSVYLKSSEELTAPPATIPSGTVIVLDNIYYDFNKSEIRKGDAGELIALAKVLKEYPDLRIELTSHTDTRGTAEYNMELSRKRSESSKAYLVLQGIQANRITTLAAGETLPRNECADDVPCTEEQHQYNRRTEVRIINPAAGMEVRYKSVQ